MQVVISSESEKSSNASFKVSQRGSSASLRCARDDERRDDKLCRKFLQYRFVNANSSVEIFQRKILVGRVRATVGQCESQ